VLLLLITAWSTRHFQFTNFCIFVQRLYSKNQGGPVIILHRVVTRNTNTLSCCVLLAAQSQVLETLKRAKVNITQADSISDAVLLIRCEIFVIYALSFYACATVRRCPRLYVCMSSVRPSVRGVVSAIVIVCNALVEFHHDFIVVHLGTTMIRFWGQKVKGQGHSITKYSKILFSVFVFTISPVCMYVCMYVLLLLLNSTNGTIE